MDQVMYYQINILSIQFVQLPVSHDRRRWCSKERLIFMTDIYIKLGPSTKALGTATLSSSPSILIRVLH